MIIPVVSLQMIGLACCFWMHFLLQLSVSGLAWPQHPLNNPEFDEMKRAWEAFDSAFLETVCGTEFASISLEGRDQIVQVNTTKGGKGSYAVETRAEVKGAMGNCVERIAVFNPQYSFQIHTPVNGIRELTDVKPGYGPVGDASEYLGGLGVLRAGASPANILGQRMATLFSSGELTPISFQQQSEQLVLVEFSRSPSFVRGNGYDVTKIIPIEIQSGRMLLDKKNGWMPVRIEVMVKIGKDQSASYVRRVEYESMVSFRGVTLPSRHVNEWSMPNGVVTNGSSTFEWKLPNGGSPDKEFTLTAYGFPEPPFVKTRGIAFGPWTVGIGLVTMAGIIHVLRKRKK